MDKSQGPNGPGMRDLGPLRGGRRASRLKKWNGPGVAEVNEDENRDGIGE